MNNTVRCYPRSLAQAFPKDHAAAIEVYRKPKEPLGWIVCRWLSAFILVCMAGALAFGY